VHGCASPQLRRREPTRNDVADHIEEKLLRRETVVAMRKASLRICCAVLGFVIGVGIAVLVRRVSVKRVIEAKADYQPISNPTPQPVNDPPEDFNSLQDAFVDVDHLVYNGYEIDRLHGQEKDRFTLQWMDISYVAIKKNHRLISKFDFVRGPMGAMTDFGMYPFLGDGMEQLLISQDIFRGGTQWVVRLYPRYKVIFDGRAWGVGRERDDMEAVDLDDDGVSEIIVPLTFYELQDKFMPSACPMPSIVFKYNPIKERYFPVNHVFTNYALRETASLEKEADDTDAQLSASASVRVLIDYVYAGKEAEGAVAR
jgi:hypothetical protein